MEEINNKINKAIEDGLKIIGSIQKCGEWQKCYSPFYLKEKSTSYIIKVSNFK